MEWKGAGRELKLLFYSEKLLASTNAQSSDDRDFRSMFLSLEQYTDPFLKRNKIKHQTLRDPVLT